MRVIFNEAINIQMTFNMIKIVTVGDLCEKNERKFVSIQHKEWLFQFYEKCIVMESSAFERQLRITSVRMEAKGDFQVHDEERQRTTRRTRNERNEGIRRLAREIKENGRWWKKETDIVGEEGRDGKRLRER